MASPIRPPLLSPDDAQRAENVLDGSLVVARSAAVRCSRGILSGPRLRRTDQAVLERRARPDGEGCGPHAISVTALGSTGALGAGCTGRGGGSSSREKIVPHFGHLTLLPGGKG